MNPSRTFLFLQGVASPLFARLADELEHRGHHCLRINFCPGDRLFWRRAGATNYRGRYDEWPAYVREFLQSHEVTDLVLFSDTRPLHRLACREAQRQEIRVHVFEEGYLRPYCLTVDLGGANGYSALPASAEGFLAAHGPDTPVRQVPPVPISFFKRAGWDAANHAGNLILRPLHPHYESHRPHHPLRELHGWSRRVLRRHLLGERGRHLALLARFLQTNQPFFLLPLQLDSDSQVTLHSDFRDLEEVMDTIFASFAAHAPPDHHLVVKCHPLDNDLVPRGPQTRRIAAKHGVLSRVLFVDGGHLPTLLARATGMVTVNSTVATSAFDHGCPTKALGRAIYNFEGLTAQASLDEFWHNPPAPDPEVNRAFRATLLERCLVHGSFYSTKGVTLAVRHAADLLHHRSGATAGHPIKPEP